MLFFIAPLKRRTESSPKGDWKAREVQEVTFVGGGEARVPFILQFWAMCPRKGRRGENLKTGTEAEDIGDRCLQAGSWLPCLFFKEVIFKNQQSRVTENPPVTTYWHLCWDTCKSYQEKPGRRIVCLAVEPC